MKNPVNVAKKSYGEILKINDIINRLNNISQQLQTQNNLISDQSNQINQLKHDLGALQEQNRYLKDLIISNVDIQKVPKATGNMRLAQLANLELLKVIKKICEKHHLEYFLTFGSLLGAIRHHGYVPWDDDIDIIMMREDYNKLLSILDKEFANTDLFYVHSEIIRIYYGKTPVQIDIFPADFYHRPVKDEADRLKLGKKLIDIHNHNIQFDWEKLKTQERTIVNLSYPEIEELRRKKVGPDISKAEAAKIHPAIHNGIEKSTTKPRRSVLDYDWIFPLKKALFEGVEFPIPNQPDPVLRDFYQDYMTWPPEIKSKHHDIQSRLNNGDALILKQIVDGKINLLKKTA